MGREGERENLAVGSLLRWLQQPGWAVLDAGARNCTRLPTGAAEATLCPFPGCIRRKLPQKQSNCNSNLYLYVIFLALN